MKAHDAKRTILEGAFNSVRNGEEGEFLVENTLIALRSVRSERRQQLERIARTRFRIVGSMQELLTDRTLEELYLSATIAGGTVMDLAHFTGAIILRPATLDINTAYGKLAAKRRDNSNLWDIR